MNDGVSEQGGLDERTAFVLGATDSLIWAVDLATGHIEAARGPASDLLGAAFDGVDSVSGFLREVVHPEDRGAVEGAYREVVDGARDRVDIEFRTDPPGGGDRWLRAEGRVRESGDDRRLVGIATDISDRKSRERALSRRNEQLRQFAGVVSHDLQNPLNVAMGRVELAAAETGNDHLDHASRALDRMGSLVDDLLALAESGIAELDPEPINLAAITRDCWGMVDTDAATLAVTTDRTVRADRTALRRVLENLLRNAVTHGGDGVTVRVDDFEAGFCVADDGAGIPAEAREAVLERGYSSTAEGSGLGLAIVRNVARSHGWSVRVGESDAGGARIEVRLDDRAD